MQRTLFSLLIAFLCFGSSTHAAREILLRLQPAPEAPVIAKVTASDKVLLDTAPAPSNAELGWRQIALPTPFEGYVPEATLGKNFEIIEGTAVQYLPTSESAVITRVEQDDHYEVVRVKDEWATVRFKKDITGYFVDDATEEVAINFDSLKLTQASTQAPKPIAFPEPVAIPAPRARVNPDQPIAQLDPNALPPENVSWQAAGSPTQKESSRPAPHSPVPTLGSVPIMVSPDQTQAREAAPELGPAKTPRLLTGKLVREIHVDGPDYPIRLKSPEGRLIAYVDFSKIYVSDLAPYLNQKVYIRGQIYPLPNTHSQLVILAETLKLAPQ
ncbi:hypothetical protein ACWPKS_18730 [Coraliomargarita sp. W4R72]